MNHSKRQIIDYYDDSKWGRVRGERKPFERELEVINFLKSQDNKAKKFLDVGCGDGYFMNLVKKSINHKEIIGVDYSKFKIKNKRTNLKIIRANIETELSKVITDNHFDILYLGEVIEHVFNPDLLLRTCKEKLRKNGLLILSTPNLNSWYNRILFMFGFQPLFYEVSTEDSNIGYGILRFLKRDNLPVGHVRLFNVRSISELLNKEGFEVVKIVGSPFEAFPAPLRFIDRIIGKIFVSLSSDLIVFGKC